jgi:purine-cytosine permease-like protein
MRTKISLIVLTLLLGVVGVVGLICGSKLLIHVYMVVTVLLFVAVAVGGLLQYNSSEMRDFRDIYREKNKMNISKISRLEKELSNARQAS